MKRIIYFLGLIVLMVGCKVATLQIDTMRPAQINIPGHILKLGVVNRSLPGEGELAGNILEGVLTGEGIGVDRRGSQFCVEGLTGFLNESPRFSAVLVNDPEMKGTGRDEFAPPIPWYKVEEVCKKYGVDALLVLESFDSDNMASVGKPEKRTRKENEQVITYFVYPSRLMMTVRSGWRIYDPKNKTIVDENIFTDEKVFTAEGSNPEHARANLPSLSRAVKESGLFAGERLGFRISPHWVRVSRSYYRGKHEDLKRSHQMVKRGNYDQATLIWKKLTALPDEKTASRAAYNMALAAELNGEIDLAIEWATKSRQLGNKKALAYIHILEARKLDEEKLKIQLDKE